MALFNYECDEVKRKIDEVSPNYPQLTTFEKEWLFFHKYNYNPGFPVDLEYETVRVNPYGRVDNAIPFNYKSAILKGNTLLNLSSVKTVTCENEKGMNHFNLSELVKNKKCLIKWDIINNTFSNLAYRFFNTSTGARTGTKVITSQVITTIDDYNAIEFVYNKSQAQSGESAIFDNIVVVEYQEGMENWDIPYFESTLSVKMAVLMTTGKNLFNKNKLVLNKGLSNVSGDYYNVDSRHSTNYIEVEGGKNCCISNMKISLICYYDYDKNFIESRSSLRHTIPNNAKFLRISIDNTVNFEQGQLEINSTSTPYEPFKSNILTVNEEVTLRSNGDVYDELNLLTGRLTQRIDENNEVLSQEVVKTVDLTPLNIPFEGTNHYHLTSNIPCEAILEVPVVSTGEQTLQEINN